MIIKRPGNADSRGLLARACLLAAAQGADTHVWQTEVESYASTAPCRNCRPISHTRSGPMLPTHTT